MKHFIIFTLNYRSTRLCGIIMFVVMFIVMASDDWTIILTIAIMANEINGIKSIRRSESWPPYVIILFKFKLVN